MRHFIEQFASFYTLKWRISHNHLIQFILTFNSNKLNIIIESLNKVFHYQDE